MADPYTADHVLLTYEEDFAGLVEFATDLGAEPDELRCLPDDPSRAHWSAAFVAGTMNELEDAGLTAADWVRSVAMSRRRLARPEPIAGASAGLL